MAIGGIGKQRPCDEGAERRGEPRARHDDLDDDDSEEGKRRHGFADAGAGDQVERPAEQVAPGQRDRRDGDERGERPLECHRLGILSAHRE